MTVTLPRIDSRISADDGRMTKEWYRALKATNDSLNTSLLSATIYTDTGSVNTIRINSGVSAYSRGLIRYFVPKFTTNSSSVTLADGGLPAVAVLLSDGTMPAPGQIVANITTEVIHNGTNWELQVTTASSSSVAGNFTVGGTLQVAGATTLTGGVTGAVAATGAVSGSTVTATSYIASGSVLVSALPSAATAGAGARMFVTDATATTFHSIVAGTGANKVPVVSDGTNWLIG